MSKIQFRLDCKDCEQKARNEKKNDDRPQSIIEERASKEARKARATKEFFMVQMNYQSLVPQIRAFLEPGAKCPNCGHPFMSQPDVQTEHIEPPRHSQDWARLHARNLHFYCGSCNQTKGHKPFEQWLDEQEGARLSNLEHPAGESERIKEDPTYGIENGLFGWQST